MVKASEGSGPGIPLGCGASLQSLCLFSYSLKKVSSLEFSSVLLPPFFESGFQVVQAGVIEATDDIELLILLVPSE